MLLTPSKGLPVLSLPVIAHGWVDWSVPESPEEIINEFIEKSLGIDE